MRNAAASPQIKPAPALVARRAKRMPNPSPNSPPTASPCEIGVPSAKLCIPPPPSPAIRPRAGSTHAQLLVCISSAGSDPVADMSGSLLSQVVLSQVALSQVDGLDDVFREEEFHRPIHQYSNFAFQSRQLSQINSPPHQPREQSGEAHRLV